MILLLNLYNLVILKEQTQEKSQVTLEFRRDKRREIISVDVLSTLEEKNGC